MTQRGKSITAALGRWWRHITAKAPKASAEQYLAMSRWERTDYHLRRSTVFADKAGAWAAVVIVAWSICGLCWLAVLIASVV